MIRKLWDKYKDVIIHEIGFWIILTGFYIQTDGTTLINALYNQQFESAGLNEIKLLLFGSALKALLVLLFPSLFPLYRKDAGILPPKNN